jgi:peptide/nickel transport system permease protein
VSLYIIGIACLLAILAYLVVPDNSPQADRKIAELKGRPPGFSALMLKLPRKGPMPGKTVLARLFTGTPPQFDLLPISTFFFARDTIVVEHYISQRQRETLAYPIRMLLPPGKERLDLGHQQHYIYTHNIDRKTFILGTDSQGRDIISRLILGTRISLAAALVAGLLSLSIGLLLGTLAGYYRGWLDNVIVYLVNVLWAVPAALLVFAVTLSTGRGPWQIFMAIGLSMSAGTISIIRKRVRMLREREYVQAARLLGVSHTRIMLRHILPHMAGHLLAIALSGFATAMLIEGGLSFLGIGVQPPIPTWGGMVREAFTAPMTKSTAVAFLPGIALAVLAFAFYTLASSLRNLLDLREQQYYPQAASLESISE